MKGLIIIAALLLTGCSDAGSSEQRFKRINVQGVDCVAGGDGTGDNRPIAITCDWGSKSKPAKPEPIKFYTIPGYDCETDIIPGHCTKWNITQAEYDKKNSHLFKVTE